MSGMWWMRALAVGFVALPLVLMVAFNRSELADSRGRRLSRRWRANS
jgi:hypothetical protein